MYITTLIFFEYWFIRVLTVSLFGVCLYLQCFLKFYETMTHSVPGLASSGGNCETAEKPGIFEDMSMYHDWIVTTLEETGYPYQY